MTGLSWMQYRPDPIDDLIAKIGLDLQPSKPQLSKILVAMTEAAQTGYTLTDLTHQQAPTQRIGKLARCAQPRDRHCTGTVTTTSPSAASSPMNPSPTRLHNQHTYVIARA